MKQESNSTEITPVSGNIFGWKISFISLGIILVTLLAVIIFDDPPPPANNLKSIATDTLPADSID